MPKISPPTSPGREPPTGGAGGPSSPRPIKTWPDPLWQAERATLTAFLQASAAASWPSSRASTTTAPAKPSFPADGHPWHDQPSRARERFWFQQVLAGRPAVCLAAASEAADEGGPFATQHRAEEVLTFYRDQCAISDQVLTRTRLTASPSVTSLLTWPRQATSAQPGHHLAHDRRDRTPRWPPGPRTGTHRRTHRSRPR